MKGTHYYVSLILSASNLKFQLTFWMHRFQGCEHDRKGENYFAQGLEVNKLMKEPKARKKMSYHKIFPKNPKYRVTQIKIRYFKWLYL